MATVSDREDKLARREKELARIRDEMKTASHGSNDLDSKLTQAQADRLKLEAEVAELQLRLSAPRSGGDVDKTMDSLRKERDRQSERLSTLLRENKRLRSDLEKIERSKTDDWTVERRDSALLREQINELAAEMVHLTAMIDGSNSPITQILASAPESSAVEGGERIVSLADRVKALQKAASATSAAPEPVQRNR